MYKPKHSNQCDQYAEFVRECSGGTEGTLLSDIDGYIKQLECKRVVRGALFKALASIANSMPEAGRYITAVVKAFYSCAEKFAPNGDVKLLAAPDISSMSSTKKAMVLKANGFMVDFLQVLESANLEKSKKDKIRGDHETKLVQIAKQREHKEMHHICWDFFGEVVANDEAMKEFKVPASWGSKPVPKPITKSQAPSLAMKESTLIGLKSFASELARKGFSVGAKIVKMDDKQGTPTVIREILGDKVQTTTAYWHPRSCNSIACFRTRKKRRRDIVFNPRL